MNKDSKTWWEQTKRDSKKLAAWLLDQYRGEASAAGRIELLRDTFARDDPRAARILTKIAAQERNHACWVAELLRTRGLEVKVEDKPERYWPQVMLDIQDLQTGCAVGAHAERMRLMRIEAICEDPEAPEDVRRCFLAILPEERFHARAFASLATEEALARTEGAHALGLEALGLSA